MIAYPTINYIGNKEKIIGKIASLIPEGVTSFFDAFCGGCSVSYMAKANGLQVFANDILSVNFHLAKALIENNSVMLTEDDVRMIFDGKPFAGFMTDHYAEKYYFEEECKELDLYRANIDKLDNEFKHSMAICLLRRAMIRKMPYSRFTIGWNKIKELRDEEYSYSKYGRRRHYHNQSFRYHFLHDLTEYNLAVFFNGKYHETFNHDVFDAINKVDADLIYLDPPYAGTMNDYHGFYGLLDSYILGRETHPFANNFTDKSTVIAQFDRLFGSIGKFKYCMMSYNSRSKPTKEELLKLMNNYFAEIELHEIPYAYKVTGKENKQKDIEYIFIAKR